MIIQHDYTIVTIHLVYTRYKVKNKGGKRLLVEQILPNLAYGRMGIGAFHAITFTFQGPKVDWECLYSNLKEQAITGGKIANAQSFAAKNGYQFVGYMASIANGNGTSYIDLYNARFAAARGRLELVESSAVCDTSESTPTA